MVYGGGGGRYGRRVGLGVGSEIQMVYGGVGEGYGRGRVADWMVCVRGGGGGREEGVGVEIGSKEVVGSKGRAFAEKLGTGLGIGEATVEVNGLLAEDGEFGGEEGGSEGVAADGLAEGAGTGGEFG
jgi:hypothetical protein